MWSGKRPLSLRDCLLAKVPELSARLREMVSSYQLGDALVMKKTHVVKSSQWHKCSNQTVQFKGTAIKSAQTISEHEYACNVRNKFHVHCDTMVSYYLLQL